jgi:hypothetical protein
MNRLNILGVVFVLCIGFVSATSLSCGNNDNAACSAADLQPTINELDAMDSSLQSQITYISENGLVGEKGDKGDMGAQGEQGIQGEKGEKGDKGEDGKDGNNGIDGKDGEGTIINNYKNGGGTGIRYLSFLLVGNHDFLQNMKGTIQDYFDTRYVKIDKYNELKDRVQMLETWANYWGGYNYNDDYLQEQCAQNYGKCGSYCIAGSC